MPKVLRRWVSVNADFIFSFVEHLFLFFNYVLWLTLFNCIKFGLVAWNYLVLSCTVLCGVCAEQKIALNYHFCAKRKNSNVFMAVVVFVQFVTHTQVISTCVEPSSQVSCCWSGWSQCRSSCSSRSVLNLPKNQDNVHLI